MSLMQHGESWVMPAPDMATRISFYEDFPYAWWNGFGGLADLDDGDIGLPAGVALEARYSDISDQMERKQAGLRVYDSQVQRLFESDQGMLDAVAGYASRVAQAGGVGSGVAERYWSVVRS